MTLEELKKSIELNTLNMKYLIMVCPDETSNFIFHQYLNEYSNKNNIEINFIESINSSAQLDLFSLNKSTFDVFICDKLSTNVIPKNVTWVRCKSIDKNVEHDLLPYVVNVPKLEPWHIKDYVYTLCDGLDQHTLDYLADTYKNNIYRLDNEINKLLIFNDIQKIYPKISAQLFNEISDYEVFDLVNALVKCDIISLRNVLLNIDNVDIDIFGVIKLLQINFKRVIDVQLSKNADAKSLGMSDKQFYAIRKYSTNIYTRTQLLDIYEFITGLDYDIKSGYISVDNALDYIVTKIISIKRKN